MEVNKEGGEGYVEGGYKNIRCCARAGTGFDPIAHHILDFMNTKREIQNSKH